MTKILCFISDLHLHASSTQNDRLFGMFMEYIPEKLEAIYLF